MGYGYGYGFYMDWTYVLVLIGAVLCMAASAKVNSTYSKYARVRSMSGMTGAQAAQRILNANGIYDVRVGSEMCIRDRYFRCPGGAYQGKLDGPL